jgi:threonine dehydrogenase-like Zn-dependent dehydrogenase
MDGSIPLGINSHWGGQVSQHLVPMSMHPVHLPEVGDPLDYAITQVAAISYRGAWIAQPQAGETAVVIGQGAIGAFNAAWLGIAGCRVIVVDREQSRLDRAMANGAAAAVRADDSDALARIKSMCPADGADIVVESAGVKPAVQMAHALVRRTPKSFRDSLRTVEGNWPRLVYQANYLDTIAIDPWTYFDGEGVVVLTPMDRNNEDQQRVVEAIRRKALNARAFIDRVVPVSEAPAQYADLRDHKDQVFSVVYDWTK